MDFIVTSSRTLSYFLIILSLIFILCLPILVFVIFAFLPFLGQFLKLSKKFQCDKMDLSVDRLTEDCLMKAANCRQFENWASFCR